MPKKQPQRRLSLSRYSEPPGYDPRSGKLPNHGKATRHHMIPRSRGGKTVDSNLLEVPERVHQCLHYIFTNMLPEEMVSYILAHWSPHGYFDLAVLQQGNRKIVLRKRDLIRLSRTNVDRFSLPNFRDEATLLVKPLYRRRRRRMKPRHK